MLIKVKKDWWSDNLICNQPFNFCSSDCLVKVFYVKRENWWTRTFQQQPAESFETHFSLEKLVLIAFGVKWRHQVLMKISHTLFNVHKQDAKIEPNAKT